MRVTAAVIALVACAVTGAACGDDGPELVSPVVGPSAPPPVSEVLAVDFAFEPRRIVVDAGTEVRFVNVGRNNHDVIPEQGEMWGVGLDAFAPGERYAAVFSEAGEYPYVCTLHLEQEMTGIVVVRE